MNKKTMNLELFGDFGKEFFTNAFEEAYNITEGETEDAEVPSEPTESTESASEVKEVETSEQDIEVSEKPSKEEIERLYKEYFGEPQAPQETHQETEIDAETQSALELYKYLEENPHLVQAMRDVDVTGYNQLNNYVPDELTKKVQEMEEFIQEQRYNSYISELKGKYNDFDEDKVVEYAEQKEIYDLEVAYKALKSDSIKVPNEQEIREQIKKELLEELKKNSLSTQTIVSGIDQKPNTTEVSLTAKQKRVAQAMGMSEEEYAKWI